ncbi:DUF4189 domain-containing protein [Gordonia sp. TBRC 11910]|uniref:DUF4189 domain-containing protein n=1 Tax=Gordonia asplenii TaxID=2725283 RepID=A0A848L3L4_9ACTN|nr:DUF4189 domain-containing protein [Gordonia asplenii]NMO05022.1 DUF4189 domain-containing protein [Gordonia asplenii]
MKTALKSVLASGVMAIAATAAVIVPAQASAADHNYGAISISKSTGNHASSSDYTSVLDAIDAANAKCNADDCGFVVMMDNNCGALAYQPITGQWGWTTEPTRDAAESGALSNAGVGAKIVETVCMG